MDTVSYVKNIWAARYFWLHLSLADIRAKYRRSILGLAWAVIQPFMMTLLLTFVMGSFFKTEMGSYAPFIFSGLITWEFIVSSSVTGCTAFTNAEGYIKQFRHPLMIYTLRAVIPCFVNFFYAFIGLIIWVLVWKPSNFGFSWISLPLSFGMLFLFTWPLTTINAFIGTKFRDFTQLIVILLQVVYYISPIFFLPKMFLDAHLSFLLQYNPIAHLLNLIRSPLMRGEFPHSEDYLYTLIAILFLWFCSWIVIQRTEKKVIFYL